MDCGRLIMGISASIFILFQLPNWMKTRQCEEKFRMVSEALDRAEERVKAYEESHHRILTQICQHYLSSTDLDEALAAARTAKNDAMEFAAGLRDLQMKLISSYPYQA